MREYQKTRNNPYLLPHHLYMRIVYTIRDYDRMRKAYDDTNFAEGGAELKLQNVIVKSLGNYVQMNVAVKISKMIASDLLSTGLIIQPVADEVTAIEVALEKIPDFYQKPIYDNIVSGTRYPIGADERTFRRYKQRFIYYVAKELGKI